MPTLERFYFENFQVDLQNARLSRDDQVLPLTPKAFGVLVFLCTCPGRLISKEELLDTVWQRRFVSDGVLKNTIQELRRALDDDCKAPRYIETVHRRGYRFLGQIRKKTEHALPIGSAIYAPSDEIIVVGREQLLSRLNDLLQRCMAGQPQTVFLSGEAGIGKTTLMRRFSALLPDSVIAVGGQCVAQYGEVEPYLPLLEALNQLARHYGSALVAAMQRYAPTWLVQLPWLLDNAECKALQNATPGLTKERMRRELGAFLEYWTRDQPHALILVLEDLHWSDHATLDTIIYLARRPGAARWMILGSYRPVELIMNQHPLQQAARELRLHRLCHEIVLPLLPEEAVLQYLQRRFEGNPLSARLMHGINRRTEGLPLYLVHLCNELLIWREQHQHSSDEEIEGFFDTLPESLKLFIEQQFSRLPAETQVILEVAAVAGSGFSASMLARVTGGDELATEDCCERLADEQHIFICPSVSYFPERRASRRFAFIHAYYQKLAYERIPLMRRAALHLALAEWFETVCGARVRDLAAEIAMHFEQGRSHQRALYHYRIAVANAQHRYDPHAVAALARRALAILEQHLPAVQENVRVAVEFYTNLATAIQVTHGWAAPELQSIFESLLRHEQLSGEGPHRLSILWGLMGFYFVRGQLQLAEQCARHIEAFDRGELCPEVLICSYVGYMGTGLYAGRLASSLEHFQASLELYRAERRNPFPVAAIHPVVLGHFFAIKAFWLRGFPDQALDSAKHGIEVARSEAEPFSVAFIHWGDIVCRQLRGEAELTDVSYQALMGMSDEQGFALLSALAVSHSGWVYIHQGKIEEGAALMQRGIALFQATGARLTETYLLASCIDAFVRAGLYEQSRNLLEEAFRFIEENGERYFEAELHRLKGETIRISKPGEAESYFRQALAIARLQGALSLELRAAMSLARLWLSQSCPEPARELLHHVYAAFTEGFETRDLREARALLAELNDLF